jgi:hypothetical protein
VNAADPLRELTGRLEQAAAQLRDGELEPERAAELVQQCARLAGEAASELDRQARAASDPPADPPPGQGELLAP